MAKYEEPESYIQEIFDNIIATADLERFVTIKVLIDDNQKTIGKMVKANAFVQHLAGVDVIIVINQRIFEQLPQEQQDLQAEELLAGISWDMQRDKLVISKGDIQTYSGLLRKYGYKQYEVLQESIKTLYAAAEEEDAR
jgi:hypothetical protein